MASFPSVTPKVSLKPVRADLGPDFSNLTQSARRTELFLYCNILGEAQALRQNVQLARDAARSDVTAAPYGLVEDAFSSLFRRLHLSQLILGKVGSCTLASLDDAFQGLLGQSRAQLILEDRGDARGLAYG